MNFDLSEEQQLLADTLRRYLNNDYTFEKRATIVASPSGWSESVWAALADMGILGVPFAEEHGGYGGSSSGGYRERRPRDAARVRDRRSGGGDGRQLRAHQAR